jgi:dTMP kinase
MARGVFIALEGGEGAGKDTQIELLKSRSELQNAVFTREPGGTEAGNEIRALLLKTRVPALDAQTELMLFLAARAELMQQVVRPALASGKTVISNRFGLSTYAYQIYGRQRPELLPLLQDLSTRIVGGDKPHYLLLDISPEAGRTRVESRGAMTHFDAAELDFHARVREGYKKHIADGAESVVIDAERSVEEIGQDIWKAVSSWL